MGNPAPQPRSSSPKANARPKHRHSGSVSSISLTSEDSKPKHRHSGSVSNISFTPEDLKPKQHRKSGSVSNISITPSPPAAAAAAAAPAAAAAAPPSSREEVKDLKPKHRRGGSVSSSLTSNAEHFISPIRGDASRSSSPSSSVSSSSLSTASLKEKRNKRRTRSSLGGTEDFIKELDFLTTPLPYGRTPDNSSGTRKELLKPSPSPPLSESAPLQESEEAPSAAPAATRQLHEEGFGESPDPVKLQFDAVAEKANAEENNGGSPSGGKSFNSANVAGSPLQREMSASPPNVDENGGSSPRLRNSESNAEVDIVQPGEYSQLVVSQSNRGVDGASTGTAETGRDRPELDGEGDHVASDNTLVILENGSSEADNQVVRESLATLENGQRPGTAESVPLAGTVTQQLDRGDPVDVRKLAEAEEGPESIVERGLPSESGEPLSACASIPQNTSEQEGFTESGTRTGSVTGGTTKTLANGESPVSQSKEKELSQEEQAAKDTQEVEKVSVQKRIEELERIAGGRPVHFRSQSLSLPRPFEVSHARHHEAEVSKGFKMPAYKAPLDSSSVSELGGSELAETAHQELAEGSLQCEGSTSTDGTSPNTGVDGDETSAKEIEPQEAPVFSEAHKAVNVSPDSTLNGIHLETVRALESFEDLPTNRGESIAEAETTDDAETHFDTVEQKEVEIGKEETSESGSREASVIVPADSVPKELHCEAPADRTKEGASKSEIVEPAPGALKSGSTHGADQITASPEMATTEMLPSAHQEGTITEAPSVEASVTEQSSQDYETTILLTKQPAVDPLFIDSQQDRLWEMHSQELAIGESSGQEVRESSAQDDDPRQYLNGTPPHAEVAPSGSAASGNAQSDKSSKVDRPRTPLRSLLAEEDAEKCPDSGPLGTPPQNQSVSPRGNLFKRIVSGGKNSPTKQTTPSKFSPKNNTAVKPFLSSCMCCSVK